MQKYDTIPLGYRIVTIMILIKLIIIMITSVK